MEKYCLPAFLKEKGIDEETYRKWLYRKAQNLHRRDKNFFEKRGKTFNLKQSDYRKAIHEAVCKSNGKCFYTGEELAWDQISKFDGRKKIDNLPTVDHLNGRDIKDKLDFVIASWKVNDMKNDLNLKEFLELCERVILRKEEITNNV
jgi:hypothetical protein